ncbi:hypothetical protein [Yeosuana marina]|uniref:hypothetical protein n=1 Tax=Yeosuana marina TaxID=1565536 RepID=UPI0030ED078B|tara:strand:- start:152 stop:907 length:756 start_codon:yes stop_codon:yes gene_type:complete
MNEKINSIIISASIGIVAYMFTDIIHEVIGHSSAALIAGYDITLLTSVYFRSNPVNFIIGLCGPLANLFLGILLFIILKNKTFKSSLTKLFLTTLLAYNLFWFSGTILESSYNKTGDWTYAAAQLNIGTLTKPLLIIAGIIAYLFSIKLVANRFSDLKFRFSKITLRQSAYYAYFFGILSAIVAGLFFAPNRIAASKEGLMEMVASIPILLINRKESENNEQLTDKTNWILFLVVFVTYILFCLILGKGIY